MASLIRSTYLRETHAQVVISGNKSPLPATRQNKCIRCNKPPRPDRRDCKECKDADNRRKSTLRAQRNAQGLCTSCGSAVAVGPPQLSPVPYQQDKRPSNKS